MRIAAPRERSWELTQDEVTLVKNHIAKGASDEELKFCLNVARRYKLDPFRQQIWFVKRNDRSAEGGVRWIPIVGIGGLLHVAARDHKDFGSYDEPEYGPMKEVAWRYYEKSGTIKAPEWCRVKAWKKGADRPTVATVYWDEIYPDIGAAPLVRQMPRLMIAKCAKAACTRTGYPATDGLYVAAEFQGPADFTDGGRQIVDDQGYSPSGHAITYAARTGSHEAAQTVLAEKLAGSRPLNSEKAAPRAQESQQPAKQPVQGAKPAILDEIVLDWSKDEASPTLTGDSEVIEKLKSDIHAKWGADAFWHIEPRDAERIRFLQGELSYRLVEILPKAEKKSSPAGLAMPAARKPEHGKGQPVTAAPVLDWMEGTIEQCNPQSGKSPRLDVLLKMADKTKHWMSAWDQKLFKDLAAGTGKSAKLIVKRNVKGDKTYTNIVGFKRIGNTEYDDDGFTPVIQNKTREAGGRTLFP